jgi:hypothetical protein
MAKNYSFLKRQNGTWKSLEIFVTIAPIIGKPSKPINAAKKQN